MRALKIVDGDLAFDNQGNLLMVEGKEEERQSIEQILTTNIKEWFLNPAFGFDYRMLFVKNPDENAIRLGVIEAVTYDPRVKQIKDLVIDLDSKKRTLALNFKVITTTGTVIESEVVI